MKILSVNAGSSTLKFRLYDMPSEKLLMKGMFERIGSDESGYTIRIGNIKVNKLAVLKNHNDAVKILLDELVSNGVINSIDEIDAVGNRVVHGGNKYSKSVEVNDRVLLEIESISDLAPLHNPPALSGINAFIENIPNAKIVACFDTAFHQTISEAKYLYPVPYEWYVKYDVRKYGFHGLSHKYITEKMCNILNRNANLIICHIGNGASVSAIKSGVCIDTSMGFTPNAGLMMGTRCGDIDYTILDYVMKKEERNISWIDNQLNRYSGLFGITGMSDLRDIDRAIESNEKKALLGMDMYTDKIVDYIAKYYVSLNGIVDAICFTAGGGENDTIIRKDVLDKLGALGIKIDNEKNNMTIVRNGVEGIITSDDSSIPVYVLATDEELMIARDTYDIAKKID